MRLYGPTIPALDGGNMRVNPRLHLAAAGVSPLLGVAMFWSSLDSYRDAGRHLTPASVSVSGYYRRDGTYVRPYHRRPPCGVAHDAPYERKRSLCEAGMFLGGALCLVPVLPFLLKSHETPRNPYAAYASRRRARAGSAVVTDPPIHPDVEPPQASKGDFPQPKLLSPEIRDPRRRHRSERSASLCGADAPRSEVRKAIAQLAPDLTGRSSSTAPEGLVRCAVCGRTWPSRSVSTDEDIIVEEAIAATYCLKCSEAVKHCNCAGCGTLLSGDVAGRIMGRPYCETCLKPPTVRRGSAPLREDTGPWQQNAIRHLEDG